MSRPGSIAILLALAGCEPALIIGRGEGDGGVDGSAPDAGPSCATPLVASDVALGQEHGCAITDGVVRCWGNGTAGQLGAGTEVTASPLPFPIYSADAFVDVEAGGLLTCVRRADGSAACFGSNYGGGLADGTQTASTVPVETVPSTLGITIGFDNVYARRVGDSLTVWGDDTYGQLGLGPTPVGDAVLVETDVASVSFVEVSASWNHACAIDGAGALFCAGSNTNDALGIPGGDRDVFTAAGGSLVFRSVGAGYRNSCAVTTGGALYCWGSNDPVVVPTVVGGVGQPMRVGTDVDFEAVVMGFDHGCVLRTGGRLFCFGDNSHGELGFEGAGAHPLIEVTPGVTYAKVVAGRNGTCAIRASDSVVICFGSDEYGQRGRGGASAPSPAPVCVEL